MRSLIIIEVEHGDTTDPIQDAVDIMRHTEGLSIVNYGVRVDVPKNFVLESRKCSDCGRSEDSPHHPTDPNGCPACDGILI